MADSQDTAEKAAELIKITYTPSGTQPLFTVKDVLKKNDQSRLTMGDVVDPKRKGIFDNLLDPISSIYFQGMMLNM